jgi:thiol-disulfide isomerase/thioredoxin
MLPGVDTWQPDEGAELIGGQAPEFVGLDWLNCRPLTLSALKGYPILIRFWLTNCGLCQASAPALNYLNETYRPDGLVVIGIHHPKSTDVMERQAVTRAARDLGFNFPVAMDNQWQTIKRFWTGTPRRFTSSTFLIDRDSRIAWVHPGGKLQLPTRLGGQDETAAGESLLTAVAQALD